jgi:hypothetical protein
MDNAEIEFSLDKMLQDRAGVAYNRMNEPASDGLPVGSYIDEWNVKQAEKLLKTKNARTIINRDGTFSKVLMVKNPETGMFEVSKNPNDVLSAAEAATLMSFTNDRFKMVEVINKLTSQLGAFETSELKDAISAGGIGQILTRTDSKEAGAYKKWEEDQIGAIMSNTNNLRSILTDVKINTPDGKDYDFTYDKEAFEKDNTNSLIYINRDESSRGVYEFKPEQKKIVEETLKTAMRASIDEKHEVNATSRKPYPPTGPAPKPLPPEYNNFEEVFNEKEGKKIRGAKGVTAINYALGDMAGMRGVKYRINDDMQQVYYTDSESLKDKILFEVEVGVDITENLLNRARQRAVMKDGPLYTLEKQKTYAGKKKSGGKKKLPGT